MKLQTQHPEFQTCLRLRERLLNVLRAEFGIVAYMLDCRVRYESAFRWQWTIAFGNLYRVYGNTPDEAMSNLYSFKILDQVDANLERLVCWWEKENIV